MTQIKIELIGQKKPTKYPELKDIVLEVMAEHLNKVDPSFRDMTQGNMNQGKGFIEWLGKIEDGEDAIPSLRILASVPTYVCYGFAIDDSVREASYELKLQRAKRAGSPSESFEGHGRKGKCGWYMTRMNV